MVSNIMSDTPSSSPTMSHNGLTYALYEGKACVACGADNWRGEKIALAHLADTDTYICPPCVAVYAEKMKKN